jgi:hypothetical protein
MKEGKVIKGWKGFDKDMKCRGFQYEEGKTYETDKAVICQEGFHFCTDPFDVLNYYNLADSTFAEVESQGETVTHNEDSKVATTKIKINAQLSLGNFINAAVSFIMDKCQKEKQASGDDSKLAASGDSSKLAASGDYSKLAASGDYSKLAASGDDSKLAASGDSSKLAASGDYSKLAASGDDSQLDITGDDSVGAAIGIDNTIKGKKGNWITLAEWKYDDNKKRSVPVCVKSIQIDGNKIKADTFYKLKNGKFQEVK